MAAANLDDIILSGTNIKIISKHEYRKLLSKHLPEESFKTDTLHMIHYLFSFLILLVGIYTILHTEILVVKLITSIVVGISLSSLTFILHDLMHGSILKSRRLMYLVGLTIGIFNMFPPLFWQRVHNLHHARTGDLDDPDRCYIKEEAPKTLVQRVTYRFRVSKDSFVPIVSLILFSTGFFWYFMGTMSGVYNKDFDKSGRKKYERINRLFKGKAALVLLMELVLILSFQTILFFAVAKNFYNYFFISLLPIGIAHFVAMTYIHTNHFLSPLTGNVDDPLLNSLSLKDFRFSDKVFSNFSYHVEHHIFPAMPSSQYPKVRKLLLQFYPERLQVIPIIDAIKLLFKTPRIYGDFTHLVDLEGKEYSCLLPKA
jgi:fatty acid desaturase